MQQVLHGSDLIGQRMYGHRQLQKRCVLCLEGIPCLTEALYLDKAVSNDTAPN